MISMRCSRENTCYARKYTSCSWATGMSSGLVTMTWASRGKLEESSTWVWTWLSFNFCTAERYCRWVAFWMAHSVLPTTISSESWTWIQVVRKFNTVKYLSYIPPILVVWQAVRRYWSDRSFRHWRRQTHRESALSNDIESLLWFPTTKLKSNNV